jgi:hypothetical protein
LFLSLGISLRSNITSSLDLRDISCNTLHCEQITGREEKSPCHLIRCEALAAEAIRTSELMAVGPNGKGRVILSAESEKAGGGGALAVFSADDRPELLLRALPHGGIIEIVAPTVDEQKRAVRAIGVSGDQRQIIQTVEGSGEQQPGQSASETEGEPMDQSNQPEGAPDQPQTPGEEKPSAEADKPAGETDNSPEPQEKPNQTPPQP